MATLPDLVRSLATSPDGSLIAGSCEDAAIRIWDTTTGEVVRALRGPAVDLFLVAWSPDGRRIAGGGGGIDHTIRLWDPDTGEVRATLTAHYTPVSAIAFSADGRMLATQGVDAIGYARWNQIIRLWDVDTGDLIAVLHGDAGEHASPGVAFSPDGALLAAGLNERTIGLWHPRTGVLATTVPGEGPVAFSPDGQLLATADIDPGLVRIWRVTTAPGG